MQLHTVFWSLSSQVMLEKWKRRGENEITNLLSLGLMFVACVTCITSVKMPACKISINM